MIQLVGMGGVIPDGLKPVRSTVLAPGRQHALVPACAMLVYLAREWSHLTVRELARCMQRDPAMISRLAATYAAQRDTKAEAQVRQALGLPHGKYVNRHACPLF
jgi:hypothetical protein